MKINKIGFGLLATGLLAFGVSTGTEVEAAEEVVSQPLKQVIEPFENTTRPTRFWTEAERPQSANPSLTIEHTTTHYGAVYTGTLSLQEGYHYGTLVYEGYVYNTNNDVRPLRETLGE